MHNSRPTNLVLVVVAIASLVFSQVVVIGVRAAQEPQQPAKANPDTDTAKKDYSPTPARKKKKKKKSTASIVPFVWPAIQQPAAVGLDVPVQQKFSRIGMTDASVRAAKDGSRATAAPRIHVPPLSPPQPSAAFSNPAAITINTSGAATPYPSAINVSGLTGTITSVSLTINGFSHTFVSDVGMVLVGPTGAAFDFQDGPGDLASMSNVTYTVSDSGATQLPQNGAWAAGTFKPANYFSDNYPAPGPGTVYNNPGPFSGGTATFASTFNGTAPNGTWNLYIFDFVVGDSGSLAGGWTLNITTATATAGLMISEFRVRGPNGANDEFVEIYNGSGSDHTVAATGTGSGYGVAASDGLLRCTIPNGTVIPNKGHYLCTNSVGYAYGNYPAGNGTFSTGDATYATDIPDNAGIALFSSNTPAEFVLANRIDAVGSTSEANTLYREGTGYPALTPFSIEYAFYRDTCGKGGSIPTFGPCTISTPKDTGNNAADFIFVDTNGTSAGAGQRLGAPGPENLSGPIQRNASMTVNLLDPCVGGPSPPNRVRDFVSDPANNSTFGTLDIRRTVINNTGGNVTRLRFRIIDITTFPAPSGIADLRPRTATDVVVTVDRPPCGSGTSNITVRGTTLEQDNTAPSTGQPNGGGFNSSMSAGTVTLGTPLANGASIDVRFLLGIQQTGNFKFYVNLEVLP
jgi:hypothetical protein